MRYLFKKIYKKSHINWILKHKRILVHIKKYVKNIYKKSRSKKKTNKRVFLTTIVLADGTQYKHNIIGAFALPETVNANDIKSIYIGESVTSIGDYAFQSCVTLNSVAIPGSVKSIGNNAFLNCSNLIDLTIGNGVENIGYDAFHGCSNLTDIVIPNSVKSIGLQAFYNCINLVNVKIGKNANNIGNAAFAFCNKLENVLFAEKTKDQVQAMENYPWWIKNPTTVIRGEYHTIKNLVGFDVVLKNASNNEMIELPDQMEEHASSVIPNGTYTLVKGVTSGIDANGITYAEGDNILIDNDTELTKHTYVLPDNWKNEIDAQYPMPLIDSEDTLSTEDLDATKIRLVFTDANDLQFSILNGLHLENDKKPATIFWGDGTTSAVNNSATRIDHTYPEVGEYTLTIDNRITSIMLSMPMPEYQANANKIVEICGFGSKVTKIEAFCFAQCSNLQQIVLPKNLQEIGQQAFYKCINLSNIVAKGTIAATANPGDAFAETLALQYRCGSNLPSNEKTLEIPYNSIGYEQQESYWKNVVIDQLGYNVKYNDSTRERTTQSEAGADVPDQQLSQFADLLIDMSDENSDQWYVSPHWINDDEQN